MSGGEALTPRTELTQRVMREVAAFTPHEKRASQLGLDMMAEAQAAEYDEEFEDEDVFGHGHGIDSPTDVLAAAPSMPAQSPMAAAPSMPAQSLIAAAPPRPAEPAAQAKGKCKGKGKSKGKGKRNGKGKRSDDIAIDMTTRKYATEANESKLLADAWEKC